MYYVLSAVGAYLVIGIVLSYNVFVIPRRKMRLWDIAIGAFVMPVLTVALLISVAFEKLWKRLLIALDFNPPEEMRAGPDLPGKADKPDQI